MSDNWKSIEEDGLPPIGIPLIVTIKDKLQGLPNHLKFPVYYVKDMFNEGYCWKWLYGYTDLFQEVGEVIAWQLFPDVYELDGE